MARLKIASWPVAVTATLALSLSVSFAIYGLRTKLSPMLIVLVVAAVSNMTPLVASFAEPIRTSHPRLRRAVRSFFLELSLLICAGFADEFGHTILAGLCVAAGVGVHFLLTRRFSRDLRGTPMAQPQRRMRNRIVVASVGIGLVISGFTLWWAAKSGTFGELPPWMLPVIILAVGAATLYSFVRKEGAWRHL